jgi:hypothetical protein
MTNETPQPNTDIRRQSCMEIPVFIDFSGEDSALITVWLEDRASYLQPEAQHRPSGFANWENTYC